MEMLRGFLGVLAATTTTLSRQHEVLYIYGATYAPCIDVHPFPAAMANFYSSGDKDAVSIRFEESVCGSGRGSAGRKTGTSRHWL